MPGSPKRASPKRVDVASFDHLSPRDLYDILRLRSEVFVVEQDCPFLDPDGRDDEPGTVHLWVRDDRGVAATARVLDEGDGVWSIGRVVARPDVRGSGIADRLMTEAVAVVAGRGGRAIVVNAQAHLAGWYRRFGFEVSGPGHVEDGIPHVPMRTVLQEQPA